MLSYSGIMHYGRALQQDTGSVHVALSENGVDTIHTRTSTELYSVMVLPLQALSTTESSQANSLLLNMSNTNTAPGLLSESKHPYFAFVTTWCFVFLPRLQYVIQPPCREIKFPFGTGISSFLLIVLALYLSCFLIIPSVLVVRVSSLLILYDRRIEVYCIRESVFEYLSSVSTRKLKGFRSQGVELISLIGCVFYVNFVLYYQL